jgi:hypothetical protein
MRDRCNRSRASSFYKYGGKGVRVCERWNASFEAFLSDMGECPSPAHTLDRIENDKGYEPGNCRWATMAEQQNNRTNNRRITAFGETMTLRQWRERTGVHHATIAQRLKLGWPVERALTEPPRFGPRRPVARGG